MKLLFRQRMFSWLDSYDIFDESGNTVYVVKGKLAWGHLLKIYDTNGVELGTVKERILTLLPKFEIYEAGNCLGCIRKELSLFKPRFNIDFNGWHIEGNWLGWDYSVVNGYNEIAATVSKELWHWTDTYTIDVTNSSDALHAVMLVLAIDAEKCTSRIKRS